VDALPKGYPQEEQMGLEKPQRVAHFRALATFFLAKITEQSS